MLIKKILCLPCSRIESVIAAAVVLTAHDGRLAAKSLQSDKFKSRLSNVEKLLRDDSQLKFWLRLFEWKLVTTPLDELLLAYEFKRCIDGGIVDVCMISSISPWSVSHPSSVLELYCWRICEWRDGVCMAVGSGSVDEPLATLSNAGAWTTSSLAVGDSLIDRSL